jgi:hypothetical protein
VASRLKLNAFISHQPLSGQVNRNFSETLFATARTKYRKPNDGFFHDHAPKIVAFFPEKQKSYYGLIGLLSTNAIYLTQIYHIPAIPLATRTTINIRRCDIYAASSRRRVSSEFATKEDAARWLGDFSPVEEVQYLRYILDEILTGHDEGQRIYAVWVRGKDARAADWVAWMKRLYPELYRSLLVARNRGWVPRVQSMLAEPKPTMIVVGLYHLVGPDSIQAQLRANGLQVKRI